MTKPIRTIHIQTQHFARPIEFHVYREARGLVFGRSYNDKFERMWRVIHINTGSPLSPINSSVIDAKKKYAVEAFFDHLANYKHDWSEWVKKDQPPVWASDAFAHLMSFVVNQQPTRKVA